MQSRTRKWLRAIAITIVVIIVVPALFIFLFNWNLARGFIESKAGSATGRVIKLNGDINVRIDWALEPVVSLNNISISNMETGTGPEMLRADKIEFQFNILSVFSKRLEFPYIKLENANVLVEKDKAGRANWLLGAQDDKESKPPKIRELLVRNSKLTYRNAQDGTDLTVVADSSGDFRKVESEADNNFITLKGDGVYKKAQFHVDYVGASVLELRKVQKPYPLKTSVTIAKTTINIEGTVLDPAELQGLDITLNVKGANAADIFPIFGIVLPPTPPYSVTGKLDYKDDVWKFDKIKGKMGDSDLSGSLSFDKSKARPLLTAKFVSQSLNFKDLGGFIGAPPPKDQPKEKLTAEQKAKQEHQDESPYVIPDAPLDISRLSAMDADVEFTGNKVISPNLPLDDFYMHVKLDDLVLKVDPVKFGTANGDISAQLTVNAKVKPPVIEANFQFKRLQLGRLFEKLPIGDRQNFKGFIGGTAKLKGTGKSLREMLGRSNGDIGIGMEGGQISNLIVKLIGLDVAKSLGMIITGDQPVAVRCVIGDFSVDNGVMHSRNIVVDTANSNIKGEGTINLSNEKMDIKLQAHPKDQTILSLKSPINIGGTLKNPSVGIGAGDLLVRGGLAAAASVVLTPFVAALAFVEPGLGKDSDCAKMLKEMNQHTGTKKSDNMVPKNANMPPPAAKPVKIKKPEVNTPTLPGQYKPGQ